MICKYKRSKYSRQDSNLHLQFRYGYDLRRAARLREYLCTMTTLREYIRRILMENDPWERSITSHPVLGDESARDFVARHNLQVRDGMIILYHATPKATKLERDVIRAGSYLASNPSKAIHFAGRDRGLSADKIACYEVPLHPSELEWVGHYQTNSDIPLSRTKQL